VSDTNTSWFHCGRCGSLFQAPVGENDDRTCSVCGRNPSLGIEAPAHESALPPGGNPADTEERPADREKHSSRRRKGRRFMAKLVLGWLAVLVAIVFGARHLWYQDTSQPKPFVSQIQAKNIVPDADVALLAGASPLCSQTFSSYLAATTPEERNQFVLTPITAAPRMARFYSLNPIVDIDPRTLELTNSSILHLPGRRAIESQWRAADNRLFDAVFIEENGEWRLDWDHYVRYSDNPWPLFLAGGGENHGEFRLLARERLAEERKNEDAVSIVLYAPRFGYAGETGSQSPEFLVKRDTRNGRLLDTAFKLERGGGRVFGANLPNINPEGLIRVRVKIRRVEQDGVRRFEIEEVVACHWYSVDEPGVEIPEQAAGN
jgi:hypothetical protein